MSVENFENPAYSSSFLGFDPGVLGVNPVPNERSIVLRQRR